MAPDPGQPWPGWWFLPTSELRQVGLEARGRAGAIVGRGERSRRSLEGAGSSLACPLRLAEIIVLVTRRT